MATFGEIIYACLDMLKERSDDAYYTEEHVLFMAKKVRALLLENKYKGSRNSVHANVSDENKQRVCLTLKPASVLPNGCGGNWLRSDEEVPSLISGFNSVACTANDLLFTNVTFIPPERMPYVGYNKWLRNIIYVSKSIDGHLYLRSENPRYSFLGRIGLTGVFADPEEAAKLSHEACESGGVCDIMSQKFPLESSLVQACIETVYRELSGERYAPEDKANNAKDDLAGLTLKKPSKKSSGDDDE